MHPACRRLLLGWLAVWAGVWMAGPARAQLGQKPSGNRASAQVQSEAVDLAPWLDRLPDRQAFDRLARVYDRGTPMELPHLLFVIDRARQNRVFPQYAPLCARCSMPRPTRHGVGLACRTTGS